MSDTTRAPGQAQEQDSKEMFGLTAREIEIAHEFGHDVPGFISAELLCGISGIQAFRVANTIKAMVKRIAAMEAPAAGPWVPIGERLPEDGHPAVLVRSDRAWDRAIWEPYGWIGTRIKNITHWAEIRIPGGER